MMSALRLKLEWAILLALVIAGALASQASDLTSRVDNQLLDAGAVFARPPVDRDIVVVPIDDRSLQELGTWPWPRRIHARLIEQLTKEGARLVVLDILFPDPSAAEDDQALSDAMTANGAVFLPHSFVARANARTGVDPLLPLPPLREASAGVGHVVAVPDSDGVLRRFDLTLATDAGSYSHLALKVLNALGDSEGKTPRHGDTAIIPFHPEERFAHQPASQVLAGSTLPGFFEGKVVLVGATAQGLGDRYSVPAGRVAIMSGIGTQANLLSALRHGSVIQPASFLVQGLVTASMILALFLAFWFLPPRYGLICAVAGALVVAFASMALLAGLRLWFEPGSLIAALILAYPLWSW
ncbi:MAG: CHASE2 domain-containing protein, partial [Pseudomonadota bacterium]